MNIDPQTLRQLQLVLLEMLIEVDRICKKCDIKYNIFAGTLLGAIRHGGFIPWDDDADVAMLRPEYEKFREAVKAELDTSRFYFQDQRETKGYRWGYGKIRRKETLFLREHQSHMPFEQGVFIDIFPIDGVPDNYLLRCLHNLECTCIRKIFWSEVGRIADKNAFMRAFYGLLAKIPEDKMKRFYWRFIEKSNSKPTKNVRMLMFPPPNRHYGSLREWFAESRDTVFEGYVFQGAKDYDNYLRFTYGDYMTLPPESQRKTHPVSAIKLIDVDLEKVKKN